MSEQTASGTGLPASIEAAWGLRTRPERGPKRGLSLERIVDAAVKVAVSDGLPAVSMSRVASQLGTSAMSLYRYVDAKDELLILMVDTALGSPPTCQPEQGWRAGLTRWAWAQRAAYHRHPWALRIPISGAPATPNQVAWMEQALRCLASTGLSETAKMSTLLLLAGYVRTVATLDATLDEAFRAAGSTPNEAMASYGALLAKLVDVERYPALGAVIAEGVLDHADDPDDEFVFGLERLLDGIGMLVRD